jgi:uncharacterized protein YciI
VRLEREKTRKARQIRRITNLFLQSDGQFLAAGEIQPTQTTPAKKSSIVQRFPNATEPDAAATSAEFHQKNIATKNGGRFAKIVNFSVFP